MNPRLPLPAEGGHANDTGLAERDRLSDAVRRRRGGLTEDAAERGGASPNLKGQPHARQLLVLSSAGL